jgi:hypothetical protein
LIEVTARHNGHRNFESVKSNQLSSALVELNKSTPKSLPPEATVWTGLKTNRRIMDFLKMISALCSVIHSQSPSQPMCMYPEQWADPAAIEVNGVPRYPGSYAMQLVRTRPINRLHAFLDCF